jgi:hypothetical protein
LHYQLFSHAALGLRGDNCMDFFMSKYVIARSESAGVFAGTVESRPSETSIVLTNVRRLWYWEGAASLSQLAVEGVKMPEKCKFPVEVLRVELTRICEILDVTDEARANIAAVPVWEQ